MLFQSLFRIMAPLNIFLIKVKNKIEFQAIEMHLTIEKANPFERNARESNNVFKTDNTSTSWSCGKPLKQQ